MAYRSTLSRWWALALGGCLLAATSAAAAGRYADSYGTPLFILSAALALLGGVAFIVWHANPAYTFSAAIVLAPFSGNWGQLGVPGFAAPDRLLLVGGVGAVVLRSATEAGWPRLRLGAVHLALVAAVAYAAASAIAAGTIADNVPFFKLFEAYGLTPFLAFAVAPLVFRTVRDRNILLVSLVGLGGYLSLTTIFQTVKLNALVFPRYILDPSYGIHPGRGRGPFADAVANGQAMYVCAVACAVAGALWLQPRHRRLAGTVGVLCLLGAFMSLERSVWIATVCSTLLVMLWLPSLRRYLIPIVILTAILVGGSLVAIPGLYDRVSERTSAKSPIWDRENLNAAALRMIADRPLTGFGWAGFVHESRNYLAQGDDYPLTQVSGANLHNVFLTYAVDLGLPGLTLWALALALAVAGALRVRGPPEFRPWQIAVIPIVTFYVIVAAFVPPTVFPALSLWLWLGVAGGWQYLRDGDAA
jgi:putative inorganic carbon (hco3(-)) transporter